MAGMAEPNPTPQPTRNKGGNPLLKLKKEGKPLPPGYYIDSNNRIRKVEEVPAQAVEGEFDRLKAMRWVLNNPPALDAQGGQGVKACRAWLEKAPGPFMEKYDELERAAKVADVPATEPPVDETESDEELRRQIHELLARFESTSAQGAQPPRT